MTRTLLAMTGAVLLTTTLHAQPQTPATQPARPPDRPPTGEPTPRPLPLPEPEREGTRERDDERPLSDRTTPEAGDVESSTLTLRGCLERINAKAFRLRDAKNNDATVTEDVRLEGAVDDLRPLVGRVVEVRGTYEQGTPATTDPYFSVTRVREVSARCEAR